MRIVLYVFGSRGDAHPMIAVAQALQAEGHEATLVAPPDFRQDATARGVAFHSFGSSAKALLDGGLGKLETTNEVIAQFQGLLEVSEGADLIVGAGVPLAGPSVAERVGADFRYVAYCPHAFGAPSQPPMLFRYQRMPKLVNRMAWRVLETGWYAWLDKPTNEARKRIGLQPRRHNDYVGAGRGPDVLAADEALAPLPDDLLAPVLRVPAAQLVALGALSEDAEAFLGEGDPPVYVGFGSMPAPDRDRLRAMIAECAAATGRRFMVFEDGSVPAERARFARGCCVVGDEPHALLFPRCAAVVHHGGAGTTHTAARSGVPQVVAPFAADQFYWAERVTKLGIGLRAGTAKTLTAHRLASAVESAVLPATRSASQALPARIVDRDGARALAALLTR